MKIFIACLATESNSFSPLPTGWSGYEETGIHYGDATKHAPIAFNIALHEWRRAAEAEGHEVVESVSAMAQPAGPTVQDVYDTLSARICDDLRGAGDVDIILLKMHGAMIAEQTIDCEGDLISRLRAIAGDDVLIGGEFDPHAHLTDLMLEAADLLVFYKEYPHTDIAERAQHLFKLAVDAKSGKTRPVMRTFDCRMIGMYHTPVGPMRDIVDKQLAMEGQDGVLSLSFVHGFPWGDSPDVGSKMLAICDDDADKAARLAEEFGREIWDLREQFRIGQPGIVETLDELGDLSGGPFVLADVADNAGGGAPSDSTFILQEILRRGIKDAMLALYWDPILVQIAEDAGVGATLPVRLGGKIGPSSGDPVDLAVTVRAIGKKMSQRLGDAPMAAGTIVWLEADGIHLFVGDTRTQVFDPQPFQELGIDLAAMKLLVVKSTQHFYDLWAPLATSVHYVSTPGAMPFDVAEIPYTRLSRDVWPLADVSLMTENA
ncbi:M81 family metallopeptidase [Erythrobacter aurantius]|uniref:M81 family metallopeptidase n=1 Tax=Erythrobacter aurantius TaxID=2909249 RepID=UPI00207AD802|nr:M81 family metallopeptidase [Erythrobacter aurantius]